MSTISTPWQRAVHEALEAADKTSRDTVAHSKAPISGQIYLSRDTLHNIDRMEKSRYSQLPPHIAHYLQMLDSISQEMLAEGLQPGENEDLQEQYHRMWSLAENRAADSSWDRFAQSIYDNSIAQRARPN